MGGVAAADLVRIRQKPLWDANDPLTVSVRRTFEKCFREVYKSDNCVQLTHKGKDVKKYLITRYLVYDQVIGTKIVGYEAVVEGKSEGKSSLSKVKGYFLTGLTFAPQWTPDAPMSVCNEWATLLSANT